MATKTNAATAISPLLAKPLELEEFLAKLAARDRQNVDRHLAAADAEPEPDHAKLWRRIARSMFTLSPHAVTTIGQQALQFFIADGKYRRQLFALEDLRDGVLVVYTVDALAAALRAGALRGPVRTDDGVKVYELGGCDGHATVGVEALTADNVGNAPDYYRHMVGWNRKALKITLPVPGGDGRLRALNVLYALAARQVADGH